jgi:hypothetical protein
LIKLECIFRETLLKSCWNKTPTQRPTAPELVELLSNNPRLITPCIDVPLASVQVERTDSLELIPNMNRKASTGNIGPALVAGNSRGKRSEITSGPYSPMNGISNGGIGNGSSPATQYKLGLREPLLSGGGNSDGSNVTFSNNTASTYVPPGYIVLDHRSTSAARTSLDANDYATSNSISSV